MIEQLLRGSRDGQAEGFAQCCSRQLKGAGPAIGAFHMEEEGFRIRLADDDANALICVGAFQREVRED